MNRLLTFIGLFVFPAILSAQITSYTGSEAEKLLPIAKELAYSESSTMPIYIEFKEEAMPERSNVWSILKEKLSIHPATDIILLNSESDELGYFHERYIQSYMGYPIEMAWVNVHSMNGKVKSVNGSIVGMPKTEQSIQFNEQQSLNGALDHIGASVYKWEIKGEDKMLQHITDDPNATYFPHAEMVFMNSSLNINDPLQLCYKFNIYAVEPLGRFNYYISAKDGSVVYIENLIHTKDKQGVAATGYSGTVNIITDSVSNYYRLRESGRGRGIETYNLQNTTVTANAVDFIDSNNIWNAFSPAINKYATDAHFGAEKTYDYFAVIHNRNSIDNQGFKLVSYVHYGVNVFNAFWNGTYMTYGDGNATNTPLTTLDICGHEVAHGLTQQSSRLIYANESGALNESFSDIFGTAIESFTRPSNWNWLLGEETGTTIRSMSNPNRFGDPDTYDGLNWIDQNCIPSSSNDQCGVHTNSGVQNFWFYLLTQGGSGVNDIGNPYSVNGLGIIKAAKVAFRNNVIYLGRSSNYQEARFYGIKAAIDFFGACSPEVEEVTNAWHAVGVGKAYTPNVSADFVAIRDTSYCFTPVSVEFDSDGSNVLSFIWDFGDGNSSTQADPTHFYSNSGTYNVRLIANGGACGIDTVLKQAYININLNNSCSYFMGSDKFVTECSGNLYDDGGLNGDYSVNTNDTIVIEPSNADYVVLYFSDFDLQIGDQTFCNNDYLEVYDGSVNSAIIGKYCGNNLPPDSIVSSGERLTLIFNSNQFTGGKGFGANWQCKQATTPPIADFYSPLDTVCSAEVSFIDNSIGSVTSWYWDFGDRTSSTERNPTHTYENDGTYTVSLTASNSAGNNQIVKTNVVTVQRLVGPNTLSDTACIGGRVKLGANGNGTLQWFDQAAGGELMFQGDTVRINNLQSDTAFYVQYFQRPSAISGPFTIPGNGYFSDSSEAIYFDVYEPMILESVILNSNRTASRRIDLRNAAGEIIQSKIMPVSGVPQQVQIGFVIYPGTNYSLSIGSTNPSLYINSTGASYPYTFGSLMDLTGSSMGPNAYPFFYYWTVRPLTCYSSRSYAEGKVDTTCVITSIKESNAEINSISIYPNPSKNSFFLSDISSLNDPILAIYSIEGRLIKEERLQLSDANSKAFGQDLPASIYMVRIQDGDQLVQFKWVKTQ